MLEALDYLEGRLSDFAGMKSALAPDELWRPLPVQRGRGLTCPYTGRVMSPQEMVCETAADETFFGGAPGGGKTYLLLGLALTQHRNSVIFRQEATQFHGEDGIISKIDEMVGLNCKRNGTRLLWTQLPGGRSLQLGAARTDKDVLKWKGRPHDLKAYDELPEFQERNFRFLNGWLRTSHRGQRARVVATGNPPVTEEGRWVIRYWAPWLDPQHPNPAKPGELRFYVTDGDQDREVPDGTPVELEVGGRVELVTPRSRTFIPSALEDNPYYMETGYRDVLNNLPEPLRSMMRFGNFQQALPDDEWQVVPNAWVDAAQRRWAPDGGAGQPFTRMGNDPSRGGRDEFVVAKLYGVWVAPLEVWPAKKVPDGIVGAAILQKALKGSEAVPVQIDVIGSAGASVYDQAKVLGLNAVAINGAEKTDRRDRAGLLRFANLRAEMHWRMREALDPANGSEIALPPDPQLKADLCAPRWRPTPQGIRIEEKDEIKARIGRSPDRGEAVMYALWGLPPLSASKVRPGVLW